MLDRKNKSQVFPARTVRDIIKLLANPSTVVLKKAEQPHLEKADIARTFRQKWKDPGCPKGQFSIPPIIRGKFLNEWQIERTSLAQRSFKPPKSFKGMKIDHFSRGFSEPKDSDYPPKFQEHLYKVRMDFEDRQFKQNKMGLSISRKAACSMTLKKSRSEMKFQKSTDALFGFRKRQNLSAYTAGMPNYLKTLSSMGRA